ncbi:replication initiator protein A [Lacticaseibacillus suihuaensis]
MSKFNYTKKATVYERQFFKFPAALLYAEKYRTLSDKAKIAYMALQDRLQFSVLNNWVDADDNVYFIYTIKDLESILNCGHSTVVKVKHELEETGLLAQKQLGLNQPNHLYLAELEIDTSETYNQDPVEGALHSVSESGVPESRTPKNAVDKGLPLPGIPKSGNNLELGSRDLTRDLRETANTDSLNTESSTPEKGAEQNQPLKSELSPEKDDELERMLLDNFADSIDPAVSGDILSRSSLQLIGKWSHSVKEARERVGVILNAKRDAELEYDTYLVTEDLQDELNKALLRVVMRWKDQLDGRSERSIRNVDNYLYGAMKQIFENESVRQLNLQAKDDEDRAALRDLQDRFADVRTGKQARMEAREANRARRRQREHKKANA